MLVDSTALTTAHRGAQIAWLRPDNDEDTTSRIRGTSWRLNIVILSPALSGLAEFFRTGFVVALPAR